MQVRKGRLVIVVGVLAALAIGCAAFLGSQIVQPHPDSGIITPEKNLEVFDTPAERKRPANEALPFRIAGVDDSAPVLEASDVAAPVDADVLWSFGGDYADIGSFPVSSELVFGSTSKTPDDLQSYRAALIGPEDSEPIAPRSKEPYYEPRDGSGSRDALVWYSSTLNEQNEVGVNNWQLSVWKSGWKDARVLGTAEELNGTDQTPALPGEIVPTANEHHAYYASNVKQGDEWVPTVLSYPVDGSGAGSVVASGSFPAATPKGVLYATDRVKGDADFLGYASVVEQGDSEPKNILTVDAAESGWCVSGVWASEGLRVVSFSHAVENQGCYIGIWQGSFERSIAWFHVASPAVVGSIANDAFVWGAGSQEEHAQMYAFSAQNPSALRLLGEAPGYARPAISADASTVLVPVYNGMEAVKFDVLSFG